MAYQSIWYFTDIPEKIVDIIEEDIGETFDPQMADSKLHGDALNKDKRNSMNAWIPTNHWVGGFMWHYIQRANRENFLYDLRCIDGESMQYTRYQEGQFYTWHNDAGLATQYKPVAVGNRTQGRGDDFLNENILDVLNPKLQCKQWFWFYVSALIMGNQDRADYNLNIYNNYQKEV